MKKTSDSFFLHHKGPISPKNHLTLPSL